MKRLTAVLFVLSVVLTLVVACSPPSTGSGGGGGQLQATAWPTKTPLAQRTLKPGAGGVPAQPGGDSPTGETRGGPDLEIESLTTRMEGFEGGCVESLETPLETYVCIANHGNKDSDPFTVTLGDETHDIDGLAAGDEECFVLAATGGELRIDPDNDIEETDEDNNTEQIEAPTLTPPPLCTPES